MSFPVRLQTVSPVYPLAASICYHGFSEISNPLNDPPEGSRLRAVSGTQDNVTSPLENKDSAAALRTWT